VSVHFKTWHAVGLIAAISLAVTMEEVTRDTRFTLEALSLAAGVTALSLTGAAALLGGRFKLVESLFGGLDRVYLTHKWLGIWALVFASFHFSFAAEHDAWATTPILELPPFAARLVRQLAFLALMSIVILALNRKIPYSAWRWWHKLSGPLFLIVVLHWLSFRSPIAIGEPAGVWLAAMSGLGVAGAAYKLVLYPFVARHARYRVVAVSPGASAVHMELEPVQRPIEFKAGQFGFLRMKEDGLREPHPFTIASGARAGDRVHFVIRALGDYTRELVARTTPGMQAEIYGPYGRFERRPAKREIWIAGGVGISPFLSWLTDDEAREFDHVTLFYFFTPGRDFPSIEAVQGLATERGAAFVPVSGGPASPELTDRFADITRSGAGSDVRVSFCGPSGLLHGVRERMRSAGIPAANLSYEHFELR
jgi:predicted ferric reductase